MTTLRGLNLDDTTNCPLDRRCSTCGTEDDLAVGTAVTPVGVLCLTLCGPCAITGDIPNIGCVTAATNVLDHCGHLGCELEEMAAALGAEIAVWR